MWSGSLTLGRGVRSAGDGDPVHDPPTLTGKQKTNARGSDDDDSCQGREANRTERGRGEGCFLNPEGGGPMRLPRPDLKGPDYVNRVGILLLYAAALNFM
jgi:hypothetical protein